MTCQGSLQVFKMLHDERRPDVPDRSRLAAFPFADEYIRTMKLCWSQNPSDRPDFISVADSLDKIILKVIPSRIAHLAKLFIVTWDFHAICVKTSSQL